MKQSLLVRDMGFTHYEDTWHKMKKFTDERTDSSLDELWLLQHYPVFTLGQAGKPEHVLAAGDIPVIKSDRGGQVTYHGPGQLVAYLLFDIRRLGINVRQLVGTIEQALVNLLLAYEIDAGLQKGAPGVYVDKKKIAALGLRVRRGCSFHGLSLNVDMDLEPFNRINPCGYPDLEIVQLRQLGVSASIEDISLKLQGHIQTLFGYNCPSLH